jgi:hypothetical protein
MASTFTETVELIIRHRTGNLAITRKNNLPLHPEAVGIELEKYTAKRLGMAWEASPVPFSDSRNPFPANVGGVAGEAARVSEPVRSRVERSGDLGRVMSKVRSLASGAMTLVEFLASRQEAVAPELAEARAKVCVGGCPKHGPGEWERYFTQPASEAIRTRLSERQGMGLSTSVDDKLGICEACWCPLKLKVHFPIDRIMKRIPKADFDALWDQCWIRRESNPAAPPP